MDSKNKKLMVTTIIGIATLVLLVAGATFAYFSVPIQNNYSKTKITSKIDSIGNVTLMPGSELAMEITGAQMMNLGEDVPYYGSSEGTTSIETSEVIGTASVTGNGVFTCTYDLTMDATGENNMYEAVQSMSNNSGQLVLTVNGVRYDFSTSNLFPTTIKGEMTGLTEGVSQDITAQLKLLNSGSAVQNELIGTDIEITFELDNFNCTVTEMGTSGTYVMKTSPANISEDLVEGLYRYQGTAEEVTNNYICVGSTDKDVCLSNQFNMARIIGITPNGELKAVTYLTEYREPWANSSTEDISWPYSHLYDKFIDEVNNFPINDVILAKEWKYDSITFEKMNDIANITDHVEQRVELQNLESGYRNSVFGKVGILTINDMLLHDECWVDSAECPNGWLLMQNIDSSYASRYEWLMERLGNYEGINYAVYIDAAANIAFEPVNNVKNVRPVFYLSSDLTITGTGTIDDPYMILV